MPDRAQRTEHQLIPGAQLHDINLNVVRDHIDTAVKRRGYNGPLEPEAYLIAQGCVLPDTHATLIPTLAGMVVFGREPHRHVSVCGIDIAQFSGSRPNTSDLVLSHQIRGDLMSIIDRAVDLLWARTEHSTHMIGTERVEERAYPLVVLRELTVNAVVHRDWSYSGSYIRIQIFPDRIEWISLGGFPGRAPNGVSLETLLHAQVSRNPSLAQILYHSGRVESFGMGIDTTLSALQELGCRVPEVYDNGDIFLFRVWGKQLKDVSGHLVRSFSPRQRKIVAELVARGSCSSAQLQEFLDENMRNIQRDLCELVSKGVIIADGATSNRTYRLTEAP